MQLGDRSKNIRWLLDRVNEELKAKSDPEYVFSSQLSAALNDGMDPKHERIRTICDEILSKEERELHNAKHKNSN